MARTRLLARLVIPIVLLVSACGGGGASPSLTFTPASPTPEASPAESPAATEEPTTEPSTDATGATVNATSVGDVGTILVDGTTGMTLYTFTEDVADSGTSACTGGCLTTWPALTVAAGVTPTGGDGVTGALGTITRADDGTLQVTYKGLPLYFFKNDAAPGDTHGIYDKWEVVAP